eukprot:GHRR01004511.1.p1 GENE.GHRR01004511.1~~GHRR01004511.1.p1  ORF type:complete len:215 (+),score=64.33 GHRR01004511.1:164-808(+)
MSEQLSPRAVNVGYSPLLQHSADVTANHAHYAREKDLIDARRKFSSTLEGNVLDYLHYYPQQLEDCIKTLYILFSNIVQHPDDPKYKRIKAANKAYLRNVASVKHAEDLLLLAGWHPKVVEMEKFWVWDHETSSHDFKVLSALTEVLQKALDTLHAKAERKRKEDEERKSKQAGERERIKLALEEDRRQRKLMEELTAAHQQPSPAAAPTDAPE